MTTGNLRSTRCCLAVPLIAVIVAGWVRVGSADETAPKLAALGPFEKLQVQPAEIHLRDRYDRVQMVVTGVRSDGSLVDLTALASFSAGSTGVVSVVGSRVSVLGDGQTTLRDDVGKHSGMVPVRAEGFNRSPVVRFETGLLAALSKQGCNSGGCHGAPSGKGGFRLSLRGFNPPLDVQTLSLIHI